MHQSDSNTPRCSKCGRVIQGDDINVVSDIAYCRSCNLTHKLSALVNNSNLMDGIDFDRPPRGIQYDRMGDKLVLCASLRSIGPAAGALAIALFWNGIVSVFVLIATASTLTHLGIQPPEWFPAPEMEDGPMSLGMTIFMWIFLSPFIAIGATMIGAFFLSAGGKTEIRLDQSEGTVFTGIGPLGFRRRFLTSKVSDVRIDDRQWRDSDGDRQRKVCIAIEMHGGKVIRFGASLSEERRKFVAGVLTKTLIR